MNHRQHQHHHRTAGGRKENLLAQFVLLMLNLQSRQTVAIFSVVSYQQGVKHSYFILFSDKIPIFPIFYFSGKYLFFLFFGHFAFNFGIL